MTDAALIHEILIERDVETFIAADWERASRDFDAAAFVGYSGASGALELTFPTLAAYGQDWLAQASDYRACEPTALAAQLHAAQRIDRLEIADGKALATKIFDGTVISAGSEPRHLSWTTYYLLRFDSGEQRWLITGFVGYLPKGLSTT